MITKIPEIYYDYEDLHHGNVCIVLKQNGRWLVSSCGLSTNSVLCMKQKPCFTKTCHCPHGYENWVDDSDHCYILPGYEKTSIQQIKFHCKRFREGGSLAVIQNSEENQAIADKLKGLGQKDAESVFNVQGMCMN